MKLNTKKDYIEFMYKFLNPLKKEYSKGFAKVELNGAGATYKEEVAKFEAFSRPLWAIVPYVVGGGNDEFFENAYLKGFANGTNKNSEEYWGGFTDRDQRFVEMAAISSALIFAPKKFFDPLDASSKENLCNWLYEINNYELPENNWLFFRVLVNIGLMKNNEKYSKEQLEADLNIIESYYLGEGWYKDGVSEHRDYYVAFGMHYYGLLYSKAMEKEDPVRSEKFKDRARVFANDFIYLFANNGEAVPYGRSLTYRFAQCAFFSAILFAEVDVFDLGIIKGIISRHFEYWTEQEMFDSSGLLSVGYAYQNLIMSERYNAPGSPYWAMKSLVFLALEDNHPFWSTESKPLPKLDSVKKLDHANMIIQRLDSGKDVVAYLPAELELYGHGHIIEKYAKFAYSTAFGFSVMRSSFYLDEACPDSMLSFVIDDTVFVRKISKEYSVFENKIVSKWSPFIGIEVETTIEMTEDGHIRTHIINSDYDCVAYDSGYSLPKYTENFEQEIVQNKIRISSDDKVCEVIDEISQGQPYLIDCFPNTNILFKNTVLPTIKHSIKKGENKIITKINTFYK